MFDSRIIVPTTLLTFFTLILGLYFGILIGSNTDYQYKKIYCPKIYTETDQYIQCMNKPLMIHSNLY